jgi:hypothetical protein
MTKREKRIRVLASLRTRLWSDTIVVKTLGVDIADPAIGVKLAIVAGNLGEAAKYLNIAIDDLNELTD